MTVREFVMDALQREYSFKLGVDVESINFVKEGFMSSLSVVQFIVELEEEFGIEFTDKELTCSDFCVVGKLIELVEAKANIGMD